MLAALSFIAQAAVGLAQRFRTERTVVPLSDGDKGVLRHRFLRFVGDEGARRKQAVAASLGRVFLAVHRARQDLADLLDWMAGAGAEPPGVRERVARWFGGHERALDIPLVQAVLDVLRNVHRGLRDTVFFIEDLPEETAIARATGGALIRLGPRYWNGPDDPRRLAGVLYHEMTHLFAGTDDKAAGAAGLVYIHEPDGTEMSFSTDPPEYYDTESATVGGLYPAPEDLVRLADAHECFLEQYYIR